MRSGDYESVRVTATLVMFAPMSPLIFPARSPDQAPLYDGLMSINLDAAEATTRK